MKKKYFGFLTVSVVSILMYCGGNSPAISAPSLNNIRTIETNDVLSADFYRADNLNFSGVGFPVGASTLLTFSRSEENAKLSLLTLPNNKRGEGKKDKASVTPIEISDPINIAFDSVSQGAKGFGIYRLFILDGTLGELIAIKAGMQNEMNPKTIKYIDAKKFGITNPQGMTVDPTTGRLFVLDGVGPRIVSVKPRMGRNFSGARGGDSIDLSGTVKGPLRGLAFNPSDRHLYVLSTDQKKLYELTLDGQLVTGIDIPGPKISVHAMAFAQSLDRTDPPSTYHLFLAMSVGSNGEVTEWALPGSF